MMTIHAIQIPLLGIILVSFGTVSSDCSSEYCKFRLLDFKGELEVDCSGLYLGCIPTFNDSVVIVNLSNNNLSKLYGTFPPLLRRLDLSNNNFQKVNPSIFRTLRSLEHLGLRNTSMERWNLTTNGLRELHSLKSLDVQYNYNNGDFPYGALSTLKQLQSLYINGYPNGFGKDMHKMRKLKFLLMSGKTGKCEIPVLHERYFQHIEGIENLTITQCGIHQIYKNSISKFVRLRHFDFSYNKNLSFAVLPNVTFDLNRTDIKNLIFNEIHCTHGLGTELYLEDLKDIQGTNLRQISANGNRLELIDEEIFLRLPFTRHLQHISLSDNRLSAGLYVYRTFFLQNLKSIDVSYQIQTDIPDDYDYRYCKDTINKRQPFMKKSEKQQKVQYSPNLEKENGVWIPNKVESIFYRYSKLNCEIPEITVLNANNVRHLHLQGNTFYKWTGPIRNVPHLMYLDLSDNFCSEVSPNFLLYLYSLRVLNVSNNFLGYSLQADTKGQIFKNQTLLKKLNLASNRIQILPKQVFKNLHRLEVLDLSRNLLRNLDFEFMHMKKIRTLDISNNQLSTLSQKFQDGLSVMSNQLKVNMTNNPLECDCGDIHFWKWLAKSKFVIYSSTNTCWKGTFMHVFNKYNLTIGAMLMEKQCASYLELISVISACIFVILVFTLFVIIYRYRWKLRYLYYTTRNKHRGYTNIQEENSTDQFMFDCFVSYADEDRQFAFHDMMKNIEDNSDIKLCFHQRDFIPGFEIAENITNAIHKSRKTVCVISANYLNSYWCMFEFNMARMESIYSRNGDNCFMFIFYPPVNQGQIPLDMMYMMESQSYIEYPNEEVERVAFWLKLNDAITI